MRLGLLAVASLCLILLASASDAFLWRYSAERARLRTQAADTQTALADLEGELGAADNDLFAIQGARAQPVRRTRVDVAEAKTCRLERADFAQTLTDARARLRRADARMRSLRRELAAKQPADLATKADARAVAAP